jgi:serine phosphatase RsbU (regulator of sigma subunit)
LENNFVEKLSLQVQSFHKYFETLSGSYNLNEMAKKFANILKENLFAEEIFVMHKSQEDFQWNSLFQNGEKPQPDLSSFKKNDFRIKYYSDQIIGAAVTMPLNDSSILGIFLSRKKDQEYFSAADKIILQILLQIFNSAYIVFLNRRKEKELIFDLNEKIFQLNNLIDTGIELSRYEQKNILYEFCLERIASLTNASSALIKIIDNVETKKESFISFPPGTNPEKIMDSKYKIESSFNFLNKTYHFYLSEKETRRGTTEFNELDNMLLDAVKRQVAASIENEFLHQESLEKGIIEKELNVAATIQQQIIPKELPRIEGFEISGINIPSKEVGGDYYDCIKLNDGKVALIMADVSGKGISAALLVNTLNAALYAYLAFDLPLTEMCDKLNKLIYKSSPSDKYITFFIAILDPFSGELNSVNAGHNPIFLLRENGNLEKLNDGGLGLGMLDFDIPYTGQKLTMNSGDKIFLYTDGIPEAMNEKDEEYSDEKMLEFLLQNSEKNTEEFIRDLVLDVKEHSGAAPQSDDITALYVKRN